MHIIGAFLLHFLPPSTVSVYTFIGQPGSKGHQRNINRSNYRERVWLEKWEDDSQWGELVGKVSSIRGVGRRMGGSGTGCRPMGDFVRKVYGGSARLDGWWVAGGMEGWEGDTLTGWWSATAEAQP